MILQDSSLVFWLIGIDDSNGLLTSTVVGSGPADTVFFSKTGTSWQLGITTGGVVTTTSVTYNAGYPTSIAIGSSYNLSVTAAGVLYTTGNPVFSTTNRAGLMLFPLAALYADCTVRGVGWPVKRIPEWSTLSQESSSGKQIKLSYWSFPRWRWELILNYLKDTDFYLQNIETDFAIIVGFYEAMQGRFGTFLFNDPSDNTVQGGYCGTGDGSNKLFQSLRLRGGYVEPMQFVLPTAVYVDGVPAPQCPDPGGGQQWCLGTENLCLHSHDLTNALWLLSQTGGASAISRSISGTGPDGLVATANLLGLPSTSGSQTAQIAEIIPVSTSLQQQITFSIWLKAASGAPTIDLLFQGMPNGLYSAQQDYSQAVTLSTSWQRYWITATPYNCSQIKVGILQLNSQSSRNISAWGAQVERWANPTGYMKTTNLPALNRGIISLYDAPLSGLEVRADFTHYYWTQFDEDQMEFSEMLYQISEIKSIKLAQVKF